LVLSVDGLILVIKYGEDPGRLSGIALNHEFRHLASFNESFGEVVYISSFNDRILTITVQEDGEYQITAHAVRLQRKRGEPPATQPDYH
nr:hypothetical protein [Acidobacteriota bacterium]